MNKLLVKAILEEAGSYKWQLQGLGMLRLYLSKATRLHVWHGGFATPGASTIHTHPWDFTSTVIAGSLENILYKEGSGEKYLGAVLKCGPGGALTQDGDVVLLEKQPPAFYGEGQTYTEKAEEIHESKPKD